ncbi:1956_t:CDS:2, partial [Gigaspora margarita]
RITAQRQTNIEENFGDDIDEYDGNLYLPASFLDSKKWCSVRVANALALACCQGKPNFFITMTTNPNWQEICSCLHPRQNVLKIPTIVTCVFHSLLIPPEEAAQEMGLFKIDNEGVFTMKEAIKNFYTPLKLRFLFVQLILEGFLAIELWKKLNNYLSLDIQEQTCYNHTLSINITLQQIAYMPTEHEVILEYQRYSDNIHYNKLAKESKSEIVLPYRTTALAAQLYEGERIAHSLFQVPVEENNTNVQSTIKYNSNCANLIRAAKLIIWNELPMANKAVLDCIDIQLQQSCKTNEPFSKKSLIGVGDFRQVVLVIKGAKKSATINASVKSSHLWSYFNIYKLKQPIRNASDPAFSEFIDNIDNNWQDNEVTLDIFNITRNIEDVINFLYPNNLLINPIILQNRAFLSLRNTLVDDFNSQIFDNLPRKDVVYLVTILLKK